MSYTIEEQKEFEVSSEKLTEAVKAAVKGLEGKIAKQDEGSLQLAFNKTIHGQVLGDRTVFEVQLDGDEGKSSVAVKAYPVDAVGRELKFGARKGVTRTVLDWFWAHIDHNLK